MRFLPAALALVLATPVCLAQAQPRYLAQMQAELQAMGLAPQCAASNAQVGTCTVRTTSGPRQFVLALRYDDASDTVYVYLDHYSSLRADAATAPQAFRRLLELNWEMLIGRFEWSPASGEVRLAAVLNTDSNFDRRAFRGIVRGVLRLGDRYADEVARVTGTAVGSTPPPTPPSPAPR